MEKNVLIGSSQSMSNWVKLNHT